MKLTSTNVLGTLEHGSIINTYQSDTELMVRIVSEELFYCVSCPIPPQSGDIMTALASAGYPSATSGRTWQQGALQ